MNEPIRETSGEASDFSINREWLAQIVAAHVSGLVDAVPEPEDINLAEEIIDMIEERLMS